MNYNPSAKIDGGGGKTPPGKYRFKVDEATETTFRSGNEGIKIKLLVDAGGRDMTVFVNLVFVPKALWKLEEFLTSIGLDFNRPPEVHELVNKMGEADFAIGEKGYLEVETFLPPSANNGARKQTPKPSGEYDYGPPPMTDDPGNNIPF